jgi:hypothetical protein
LVFIAGNLTEMAKNKGRSTSRGSQNVTSLQQDPI